MPDPKPLRPISHWRSGRLAIVLAVMFEPKPFRQRHGLP